MATKDDLNDKSLVIHGAFLRRIKEELLIAVSSIESGNDYEGCIRVNGVILAIEVILKSE